MGEPSGVRAALAMTFSAWAHRKNLQKIDRAGKAATGLAGTGNSTARSRAVPVSCLECGTESAEAAEVCDRCGAPVSYQRSAGDPPVTRRTGRSALSARFLITAGIAALLVAAVVAGGLIAGWGHPGSSASSVPATDQRTVYQLRAGDCVRDPGRTLVNLNEGNGPFTAAPCSQPHMAEVFFAGNSWPRSLAHPGDQWLYDDAYARCLTAFSAYDGIDNSASAFAVEPSYPDSRTWIAGDRRLVCFASAASGQVDYSIRGTGQ